MYNLLVLISLLLILIFLRRLVGVIPSLLACLIRWKESVNLDSSFQLSADRDTLAMLLVLPFSLITYKYSLYCPGFLAGLGENIRLLATIGIIVAFILLRKLIETLFSPGAMSSRGYKTACRSAYTFFSILTLSILIVVGIMSLSNSDIDSIRNAIIWISGITYFIFIIRKFQIFASSCSFFAAFLYLCALEIIPTGALVASAIIF